MATWSLSREYEACFTFNNQALSDTILIQLRTKIISPLQKMHKNYLTKFMPFHDKNTLSQLGIVGKSFILTTDIYEKSTDNITLNSERINAFCIL